MSPTFCSGFFTNGCSTRQTCSKNLPSLPSAIFSTTCAGLPVAAACALAISRSSSTTDGGTTSRDTKRGSAAATCIATSLTVSSSALDEISTTTPILPPMWM